LIAWGAAGVFLKLNAREKTLLAGEKFEDFKTIGMFLKIPQNKKPFESLIKN
jgi:hypothetical protein